MRMLTLDDATVFALVSGLWKGERPPFQRGCVLRGTNFRGDGLLDFSDVVELDVEARHITERRLLDGDLVIERSGGGPKQPVGRVALFAAPDDRMFFTSNFTTAIRVLDRSRMDPRFVALYLQAIYAGGATETLQRATTGIRNLDWQEYLQFEIPELELGLQRRVVSLVEGVRAASVNEEAQAELSLALKRTALGLLLTHGFCLEPKKDTAIGPVPQSWIVDRLDAWADVVSTRMSYSELEAATPSSKSDAVPVLGVKVSDMNLAGNETSINRAACSVRVDAAVASHRCAPPATVVFPKRGAAIATNKKRLTTTWTAFDPNVIGVHARHRISPRFLFHWFQAFDLKTITEPGPTPQLNKKNLEPLLLAAPASREEQDQIVRLLDMLDIKLDLHRRKRATYLELFNALLARLLNGTGDIFEKDSAAPNGDTREAVTA